MLVEQLEGAAHVGRQGRLAAADDVGPDEELALVDQAGREGLRREVRPADEEIAAGGGLQLAYRGGVALEQLAVDDVGEVDAEAG